MRIFYKKVIKNASPISPKQKFPNVIWELMLYVRRVGFEPT